MKVKDITCVNPNANKRACVYLPRVRDVHSHTHINTNTHALTYSIYRECELRLYLNSLGHFRFSSCGCAVGVTESVSLVMYS